MQRAILDHSTVGKIFESKQHLTDPDTRIAADTQEPVWVWDTLREADRSGTIVYFPKTYDTNHGGLSKEAVIHDPNICAIPGWSVGFVEPLAILPKQGEGKTMNGRKQLETGMTPIDFLQTLGTQPYQGETGRTPEDFLVDFLTRLQTTNQVSYEWQAHSALWLLGSYLPGTGDVPRAYWDRDYRQLSMVTFDLRVSSELLGAASTVRLLDI